MMPNVYISIYFRIFIVMGAKKHTLEEVKKIAELKGGLCLSKHYKNATTKMKFKCSEGHVFEKDFKHILQRNQWCQKCSRNLSEEICRYIFETLLNSRFNKVSFFYKGHTLELDGYSEEYKIAFEYNGKQHYELGSLIKTTEELNHRIYLDLLKQKYCDENNINLIIIPYTTKNDELLNFIKSKLKIQSNIIVDTNSFINNYSYYKNRKKEIVDIINSNDGKLLEFNFDDIKIQCKNNHSWRTKYYVIKNGHWCRKCADKNNIRKFTDILNIVKQENINCLSQEKEYENSESILKFKCINGHIFDDKVEYILTRIAGKHKTSNRKPCQLCNTEKQNKAIKKINLHGLILINPDSYKTRNDELDWKCKNGHVQKNKAKNLLESIRCGRNLCKQCK